MEILKIIGSVLSRIILSEIILIALYNFIFTTRSVTMKRLVNRMFSAIVLALVILYVFAVKNITLGSGGTPGIGWYFLRGFSILIDIYIIYIISRCMYIEAKEVISIRNSRKLDKTVH